MNDDTDSDDLGRIADALELQNALLLEFIKQSHRDRADRRPDPDETGPTDRAIATDVVDSYGDLYGGEIDGWVFDPIDEQTDSMGK